MKDPIVAEVRQYRDEHARRFHLDLTAICRDLRAIQQASGRPAVRLTPVRLVPASTRQHR